MVGSWGGRGSKVGGGLGVVGSWGGRGKGGRVVGV